MLLLLGLFGVGFVLGRYLPRWTLVLAPALIVAWGCEEAHRMAATNDTAALAGFVAIGLALVVAAGELVGALRRGFVTDRWNSGFS